MSVGRQQGVQYSDCLREETVVESDGDVGTYVLVPSARWQEGERSIKGVGEVVHNTVGYVDTANVVRGIEGGWRDTTVGQLHPPNLNNVKP